MKKPIIFFTWLKALLLSTFCAFLHAQNIDAIPITPDLSVVEQEGTRLHLNPTSARAMTLAICQKHFPVGSQGRINIQNVVDLINDAPSLAINITTKEISHFGGKVFICPPPFNETVYIDIVSRIPVPDSCGKLHDFDATGSVFHLVEKPNIMGSPIKNELVWAYGGNEQPGLPANQAVVSFRESNYTKYVADPMNNPGEAPSEGIIAHEMGGHLLYMGHPDDRAEERYKVLESLCNHRGHSDGLGLTHNTDKRKPRITAYTRHIFDQLYPSIKPFTDSRYELVIHDVIYRKNHLTPFRTADERHFSYMNPREMYYDPETKKIMDHKTKRPVWLHAQFSNVSTKHSSLKTVRLTIKLRDKNTSELILLVKEDIDLIPNEIELKSGTKKNIGMELAQFNFDQHLNTKFDENDLVPLLNSSNLELVFKIDPNDKFIEYNESDNELVMPVTLTKKGTLVAVPMGTVLPSIDSDEPAVDNTKDFRFFSAYEDGDKIMVDINFYKKWDLDNFAVLFDIDGDERPDFKVDCKKESYMLLGKDASGAFTVNLFKKELSPTILDKRYMFYIRKFFLGLQSGDTLGYWIGNEKEDRVPDAGEYHLLMN